MLSQQRTKLMRLDRGRPEIRSISYSNRLLIDFCDSIPAVRFTRRDDPIRDLGPNSNLSSNLMENWSNLVGFGRICGQLTYFGRFLFKFDQFLI